MKVKFLKDHMQHKTDDEADVHEEQANYFIRCNVAEEVKEKQETQPAKEKKEFTPKKEKRELK
jgi:hypothetical protein